MRPRHQDFKEETDSFHLHVFHDGNQLAITLKDFTDWTMYSRQYTKDDVGNQIDRKMGLANVFNAFCLGTIPEVLSGFRKLKHYQFGTLVEDEGSPCYKIEKQGKITVYFGTFDRKTKKSIVYESALRLEKLREMTVEKMQLKKVEIEKTKIMGQIMKKVIRLEEKEKKGGLARLISLEQKAKMKQESKSQTEKNTEFSHKINVLTQKMHQLTQSNQKLIQQNSQLEESYIKLVKQFELQNQRSFDNFGKIDLRFEPFRFIQSLHSLPQANSIHFRVDRLRVQYISSSCNTQYIFNMPIRHNQSAKFKLRITQKSMYNIAIGIVDYALQKDQRFSHSSDNAMCYWSDAEKCPERVKEGDGFKQGDFVEVAVNRSNHTVKYIINGVHRATQRNQMLAGNNNRIFMPFVQMCETNDIVEWVL